MVTRSSSLRASLGPLAQAGNVDQAITFANVVLLTVPYGAIPQIGKDHASALKGKFVLDTCNAVAARDGAVADKVEANGIGVTSQKYLPALAGAGVPIAIEPINPAAKRTFIAYIMVSPRF